MNLINFYYFVEVAKDLNITKTAARLYISQQALSMHIQRLEKYYGTKLFIRRPTMALTTTGKYVLDFATEILDKEKTLKNMISDAEEQDVGTLRIGASSPRSNTYLPYILKQFSSRYPKVKIELFDQLSANLEQLLSEGKIDLAIAVKGKSSEMYRTDTDLLFFDPLYLCVSDQMLREYYGQVAESIKQRALNGADLKDFSMLPFFMLDVDSKLGQLIQNCFSEAKVVPQEYIKTRYTTMALPMCQNNLCACFITQMNLFAWRKNIGDNINVFTVRSHENTAGLTICILSYKGRFRTKFQSYFIDLVNSYFRKLLAADITHIC